MIKGWRNNPEWVRYYEEREEKRLMFIQQKKAMEMSIAAMEMMSQRAQKPQFFKTEREQ